MSAFVKINNSKWGINMDGFCLCENGAYYNILSGETNLNLNALPKDRFLQDTINELKMVYNQLNQFTIGGRKGHIVSVDLGYVDSTASYFGDIALIRYADGTFENHRLSDIFKTEEDYQRWFSKIVKRLN